MAIAAGTGITITFVAIDSRVVGLNAAAQSIKLCDRTWDTQFTDGTGAQQVQKIYAATRVLPGSSEDVDLSGVLLDMFGGAISATEVKGWGVANVATHAMTVGATGGNNWTTCLDGSVALPPKSRMAFATDDPAGWGVTAGTGDLLHIAGTSGDSYEIFFFVD